ncbi:hypothetical protein ACQY1Q_15495 [Tenacibaculum sp. TC6]|uniref:hypothetical protein n=1 Tax=Tenacibaculum sp. TC6 TaxID=3423223 RepID=UPI003D35B1F2
MKENIFYVLLLLLFYGCSTDNKIKESNSVEDISSVPQGSVIFNFNTPQGYTIGYIKVVLIKDGVNFAEKKLSGDINGDIDVEFSGLQTGEYKYTFEYWGYNKKDKQYGFVNNVLVNLNSGRLVDYRDVFHRVVAMIKNVKVNTDQTTQVVIHPN